MWLGVGTPSRTTLVFGLMAAVLVAPHVPLAPILLGYVLGLMIEENFRRALLISHGLMAIFIEQPISAGFMAVSGLLICAQIYFSIRAAVRARRRAG